MLPPFLHTNDEIRIISPSGAIDNSLIGNAKSVLSGWGLCVSEGKFAREKFGRFAGTPHQRIYDLQNALDDPNIHAIFCSRGGYGLAQIIDSIDFSCFEKSPKWLVGFSDITVLHSAISHLYIATIHGGMAKMLCEQAETEKPISCLKNILLGDFPEYIIENHALNRAGRATGEVVGGNLSVLFGLRGTPFDLNFTNKILLIEDIGEKPHHIDRMLQNLRMSGIFSSLSGLLVGQFTEYDEDPQMRHSVYETIADCTRNYDYPVCFNFPSGHTNFNFPIILGTESILEINEKEATLKFFY
ncbi:MAG: LD-carboxypeptidase [Prevotellaceae bacterium]|jgi:muramoyltetrapeptide carboxypeptidase|nr:LD-carboxypeptidase [Prevotellaceae bacterium]